MSLSIQLMSLLIAKKIVAKKIAAKKTARHLLFIVAPVVLITSCSGSTQNTTSTSSNADTQSSTVESNSTNTQAVIPANDAASQNNLPDVVTNLNNVESPDVSIDDIPETTVLVPQDVLMDTTPDIPAMAPPDEIVSTNPEPAVAVIPDEVVSTIPDPAAVTHPDVMVDDEEAAEQSPMGVVDATFETQSSSSIVPPTFLARLGQAPYGNLPVVDMAPWTGGFQHASLPEDCLLTNFGSTFCYQPSTRLLQAELSNGDPFWSFNLPGDNGSNRIDGIKMTLPTELAIVANITSEFGVPKHEMSLFAHTGEFDRTIDVLMLDNTRWPILNLQGEPLIIQGQALGSTNKILISGNTYELIPGGNSAIPSDWTHTGIATATVDSRTGKYIEISLCEGALISLPSAGPPPPCVESTTSRLLLLSRNNAQEILSERLDSITTSDLSIAARAGATMLETAKSLGLVSDLPCIPSVANDSCANTLVPNVGSRHTSSTVSIDCTAFTWNDDEFISTLGTATLTQTLVRTSTSQVELLEAVTFTDRCAFVSSGREMTGSATITSTINLDTGSVIDQETRFEDLTSIQDSVWRFHDGIFKKRNSVSSNGYQLSATRVDKGRICSRSCPPAVSFTTTYSDTMLDIERFENGSYDYNVSTDQIRLLGAPESLPVLPEQLQAALSYDAELNELNGSLSLLERDTGSELQMKPTNNLNYPDLNFVEYNLTAGDGARNDSVSERWSLPISAFTHGNITSERPQ